MRMLLALYLLGITPVPSNVSPDGSMMEQNKTQLGSNSYLATQLRVYLRENRDLEDMTKFEEKLKSLNIDAVNAALRKYFDKSKLVMVYGGDFEKGKTPDKTEKKGF